MKTIITILLIIFCQGFMFSQAIVNQVSKTNASCTLNYSDEKWIVTHKDPAPHVCKEILIKSVPPVSKAYTPIDMTMSVKGFYTFKKDPSLAISEDYTVVIEDLLTGKYFNMNTKEGYTYSINRGTAEKRFVLEISKNTGKPGNGSTASR
jgi:hypothetical protein